MAAVTKSKTKTRFSIVEQLNRFPRNEPNYTTYGDYLVPDET